MKKITSLQPLTLADILSQYFHVLITVCARLFMPKANCMHQLVHDDAFLVASGTNGQKLRAWFRELLTHWRPTPESVLSYYTKTVCQSFAILREIQFRVWLVQQQTNRFQFLLPVSILTVRDAAWQPSCQNSALLFTDYYRIKSSKYWCEQFLSTNKFAFKILKQRRTASKITFLPRPLDKPDPVLLFFTRFKAYTSVSMKLFNGSHDDSLGANWKGSLQSLHNPLNFKINPLTLLTDGYRFLFILVLRIGIKSSCQEWCFKPITPDYVWNALDHVQTGSTFFETYSAMFGIYSTTIRIWLAMFEMCSNILRMC